MTNSELEEPAFGTSGLRGLAEALTDELVASYAAVFCKLFPNSGVLFVGQDLRASSLRIAEAVAIGAANAGLNVVNCGVVPTPALAMVAMQADTISIMVTGSHIPANRNGLKFYRADGEITKADELAMREGLASISVDLEASPTMIEAAARDAYIARYVNFFGPAALSGKKIGFWAQSSAAREVLPDMLRALGGEVFLLSPSKEFVPIDTEAVDDETRGKLKTWANEHGLDAVISTDGDADRPLLADENGSVVPGDILGAITARELGADVVVTPVSANTMVDQMPDFDQIVRTKIGSPYVIAGMDEAGGRVVGYEPNGGFLLGFTATRGSAEMLPLATRDAVLPILAVLTGGGGGSVSELVASLPMRRTATDRLKDVPREASDTLVRSILGGDTSALPDDLGDIQNIDQTDGVRMLFETGTIVTIRPSGNAPELRCYVEADTEAEASRVMQSTLKNMREIVSG